MYLDDFADLSHDKDAYRWLDAMGESRERSSFFAIRPKGARNLLSEFVLKEPISHWEENGSDAIDRTCKEQPAVYLRAVLSLVPKDFAMTVERDEMPPHIEVRFVDDLSG